MKTPPLYKLSVSVAAGADEAAAELLLRLTNSPASTYIDVETGRAEVSVYLDKRPARGTELTRNARSGLKELERCGLHPRPGGVRLRTLRGADWAESWKRHFKPFDIGTALLVKPSWSPRRPRKGQAVIVIDPGLSFGTGHHPTTSFCLEQVARCRRPGTPQSLLDAGAGSGILAIAAARLGFNPVHAFDFDPQAVRVARENAQSNGVLESVRFACRDLRKLPLRVTKRFTIVCANLLADLLLAESARLLNRLEPGGTLVVAGILRKEFPQIQRHYEKAGMRLVASQSKNEWRSGAFRFAA